MRIDLYATAGCPLGCRCEACGIERDDLVVATRGVPDLGVLCLTLCLRCVANLAEFTSDLPIGVGTAARLVEQHSRHLGITLNTMAAQLRIDGAILAWSPAAFSGRPRRGRRPQR